MDSHPNSKARNTLSDETPSRYISINFKIGNSPAFKYVRREEIPATGKAFIHPNKTVITLRAKIAAFITVRPNDIAFFIEYLIISFETSDVGRQLMQCRLLEMLTTESSKNRDFASNKSVTMGKFSLPITDESRGEGNRFRKSSRSIEDEQQRTQPVPLGTAQIFR